MYHLISFLKEDLFFNCLWLCIVFPPHQGKNISEEQLECISADMKNFAPLMPVCEEYKEEPQPVIPFQNSHQPIAQPAPTLRNDSDPLQAGDWAKLDQMVRAA